MTTLHIQCLSDLQMRSSSGALMTISAKKSQALITFLSIKPGQRGERDRLHRMALRAHMHLIDLQTRRDAIDDAIITAQKSLRIDMLQEPVHRALMRLYMSSGDLVHALQQYETCAKVLKRELRIDP